MVAKLERVALREALPESQLRSTPAPANPELHQRRMESVEREQIKRAVKERTIRLIVATDAACEGLNLQTLGTLINVDLPWKSLAARATDRPHQTVWPATRSRGHAQSPLSRLRSADGR